MQFHNLTIEETLSTLKSNEKNGLSTKEATKRQKKYGFNELPDPKKPGLLSLFVEQFKDFMILVLMIAALLSFAVSALQGEWDFVDPAIIFAIIFLNAFLGILQETRAEKALSSLKKLSAPEAKVLRNGKKVSIPARELVPGDFIFLETGDFVPADARLLYSVLLQTDESALTGESLPIEKDASLVLEKQTPLAERHNMVLSSSVVLNGHGTAIVTQTGLHTEIGSIAKMILEDTAPETPLQKKLSQTGKILGILALLICVIIFILGLLRHKPVFDMFLTSVSLAVAAIPEGLPSIVTIMLSLGVQRMAKKNAIVRKLPVVETLGNATVICSDKTGTLTQNKMTVTACYTTNGKDLSSPAAKLTLTLGALCNNSSLDADADKETFGNPTEVALVHAAREHCISLQKLSRFSNRSLEIPFDSKRKRMTTIYSSGSIFPDFAKSHAYFSITKGAPDMLLPRCSSYYNGSNVLPLTETKRRELLSFNQTMASQALRVIALTCKTTDLLPNTDRQKELIEQDLIFVGLLGLSDPPRPEVRDAVVTCKMAGILPVMITGDHPLTACAIGKELGISNDTSEAITGTNLDSMTDSQLSKAIDHYRIFARVSPAHKVRIVKAFQAQGHVVAMTGDGVNDAPALKNADIGCAMGKGGTDVAKNAADMILLDDNFSTIVEAVKEGRGIYDNIQKAVHFLLSSNIGELMTIFTAILFGLSIPLLPVQLLWINLITDSLPAISLGMEPPEKGIMHRAPTSKKKSLFSDGMGIQIAVEGLMIGSLALLAYILGCKYFKDSSLELGRTLCFCVLSLSQLFHSFNMKSRTHSLMETGIWNNPRLIFSFFACAALLILVVSVPMLAGIFQVTVLSIRHWIVVFSLSFFPIVFVELQKRVS